MHSVQSANAIQQYVMDRQPTLSEEAFKKKCNKVSRKVMPIILNIIQTCCKPGFQAGTILYKQEDGKSEIYNQKYCVLLRNILQQCGIVTSCRPSFEYKEVGWNGAYCIHTPSGIVIQSGEGILKKPPNFLLDNTLMDYAAQNASDFTIICEGLSIDTHRHVLRTRSAYFDALFSSGLIEASTNTYRVDTAQLSESGTDADSLRRVIDFLYSNQIAFEQFSPLEVGRLMACANLFNLSELKEACAYELSQRILSTDLGEAMGELLFLAELLEPKLLGVLQMMKSLRANLL